MECPDCSSALAITSGEDVFISYSTPQVEGATRLARRLHEAGVRFWLAPDFIGAGENFTDCIPIALDHAKIVVFLLSGESLQSPWVRREAAMAASADKTMVGVLMGNVRLPPRWNFMLTGCQWIAADPGLDGAPLTRLVREVTRKIGPAIAETFDPVNPVVPLVGPPQGVNQDASVYVGPRPYPDGTEQYFFGRTTELAHLTQALREHPIVLVTSPSGAGKSSLLSAGLVPILRKAGHQVLRDARVGRALADHLEPRYSEVGNIFVFSTIYGLGNISQPPRLNMSLKEYLCALAEPDPGQRRVLIIDQFEEIFTQYRDRFADRATFVDQLVEAMADDDRLRVVLAMRQEYLADFMMIFEDVSPAYRPHQVTIRRLQGEALGEVIRRPAEKYVEYDSSVVDEILRQLRIVRIVQPDGTMVEQPGEYVELCHLQIVCSKLWKSLASGLKKVDLEHLNQAARSVAGRDFGGFVKNALEVFYNDCVVEAAGSHETASHGKYSQELIKLGCMKFVSGDGTRLSIQEKPTRTGRLPNWIVKQLADMYLLRIESVGGERWYELSHDLLAETVGRGIDHRVRELLFASDLLEKQLAQTLPDRERALAGKFPEHADLLKACKPFQMQPGLFAEEAEAEFILRISLRTGQDPAGWSRWVRLDYPEVRMRVLQDALSCPDPEVRSNAAITLWRDPDDETTHRLIDLVVTDASESVRRIAAGGILDLNRADLVRRLVDRLDDTAGGPPAGQLRAVALLRALADVRGAPEFEREYRTLPGTVRARVRAGAWATRFRDGLPVLPGIFAAAALSAAMVAGPFKMVPGALDWSLAQDLPGAGRGLFQGVVAGVVWGGLIPVGLMLYRLVFWTISQRADSLFRPIGSLVAGLLAGLMSSILVMFSILAVYGMDALHKMGWVGNLSEEAQRWSADFWYELLIATRMGFGELILGTMLGLGIALTVNGLRASHRWEQFAAIGDPLSSLKDARRLIGRLFVVVVRYSWPLVVTQAIAVVVVWAMARPSEQAIPANAYVFLDTLGDAATQAVGAVAAIIGTCVALLVMRRGIQIAPRTEEV